MRIRPAPHRWNVSPRRAVAIQRNLATEVRVVVPRTEMRFVAGLDAAFSAGGSECIAAVVLWDKQNHVVVEEHLARRRLRFPYVPGLLSFREGPALLAALRKLRFSADALMCDGHGLAHPRRFGIACHLGVITGLPTIGCAKSRLVGTHAEPQGRRGATAPLTDRGQIIGSVLRTQDNVRPVFVSVGHNVDLRFAVRLVLQCAPRYRLPEPTRLADRLVARARREMPPRGSVSVLFTATR